MVITKILDMSIKFVEVVLAFTYCSETQLVEFFII
ncbi:hypothetical protein [Wolbachia endosymbiont of Brugia pahangi]